MWSPPRSLKATSVSPHRGKTLLLISKRPPSWLISTAANPTASAMRNGPWCWPSHPSGQDRQCEGQNHNHPPRCCQESSSKKAAAKDNSQKGNHAKVKVARKAAKPAARKTSRAAAPAKAKRAAGSVAKRMAKAASKLGSSAASSSNGVGSATATLAESVQFNRTGRVGVGRDQRASGHRSFHHGNGPGQRRDRAALSLPGLGLPLALIVCCSRIVAVGLKVPAARSAPHC